MSSDLLAALTPLARALKFLGVRYYVGGSLASSARGLPRTTIDVDVAAELKPEHVSPLVGALRADYFLSGARVAEAVDARRSFTLVHLATMLKVDVFVSRDRTFERALFERARPEFLDASGTSTPHPIPRAEDVVLLKLEWFRDGGKVSERQWTDVAGVLKVSCAAIDRAYLARWAAELGISDLVERALQDAGGK